VSATYGKNMPSATMPTRAGHTFGGYFTGTSGTGTQYYTSSGASARAWNIAGDRTLYAKWLAGTYYLQSFEPRIYDTWWSERSPEVDFALNVPVKNVE
jgi:SLT domain-containing protein